SGDVLADGADPAGNAAGGEDLLHPGEREGEVFGPLPRIEVDPFEDRLGGVDGDVLTRRGELTAMRKSDARRRGGGCVVRASTVRSGDSVAGGAGRGCNGWVGSVGRPGRVDGDAGDLRTGGVSGSDRIRSGPVAAIGIRTGISRGAAAPRIAVQRTDAAVR